MVDIGKDFGVDAITAKLFVLHVASVVGFVQEVGYFILLQNLGVHTISVPYIIYCYASTL